MTTPLETFTRNREWAVRHSHRFHIPSWAPFERGDVVTAALLGLWKACVKLEWQTGVDDEFQRAAYPWVRGEMHQLARDRAWVKRSQRLAGVRVDLVYEYNWELLVHEPGNDIGPDDAQIDLLERVDAAIAQLLPEDRRVLQAHCQSDHGNDGTMTRLAAEMGVSAARLSQRLRRAIDTIRAELLKTA